MEMFYYQMCKIDRIGTVKVLLVSEVRVKRAFGQSVAKPDTACYLYCVRSLNSYAMFPIIDGLYTNIPGVSATRWPIGSTQ